MRAAAKAFFSLFNVCCLSLASRPNLPKPGGRSDIGWGEGLKEEAEAKIYRLLLIKHSWLHCIDLNWGKGRGAGGGGVLSINCEQKDQNTQKG